MKELVDDLRARRQRAMAMGGPEAVAKQHAEGKLTVRERLDLLFDADSFQEIGVLATHANIAPSMKGRETPADGVVTGFGQVNGRSAAVIAYDFTVVPDSARRAYDMKKVIGHLPDHGRFFEIKPGWARNLITGFCRMGERPVGIVAKQPMVLGGALDVDAADKAARFILLCRALEMARSKKVERPGKKHGVMPV